MLRLLSGVRRAPAAALRRFSTAPQCEGQRRRFEGRTRYPRAHAVPPTRPKELATAELVSDTNRLTTQKHEVLEAVRITDEEVSQIYDSIMSPRQRQMRDEQSLRHRSRAEFLELRRAAREETR
ncbi:hypothetical protein H4R21_001535, partial [Coemansia helicoidea]